MADKLRVLSVCTSDNSGGAALAAYRIHQAVCELGVDSRMLVKHKGTKDPAVLPLDAFLPHNAFYKGLNWVRNKVKNKWQHYQWDKYPGRQDFFLSDLRSTDIGNALKKIDYDILHLHWINLRFLPLDKLPKDKPIVWTLHDSWPFCGVCHVPLDCTGYLRDCGHCPQLGSETSEDLSHTVWTKKRSRYAGLDLHIVAPSHWMAACARRSSLLGDRDIRVIPNCIDTDVFSPGDRNEACARLGLDPGKRYILFGAKSALKDPNKGARILWDALFLIAPEFGGDTELILLGANDTGDMQVPGLPIRCLGTIRDPQAMANAYRAASVTVVPSLSENLSCTIMESLSCGTPVTAFAIGGNGDMIEHKTNGYLARGKDARDLADGIRWCLSQDKEVLANAARTTVLDRYMPEAIGQLYLETYQALVNNRLSCFPT